MATTMRLAARSTRILLNLQKYEFKTHTFRRNFLSAAYLCDKDWDKLKKQDPQFLNSSPEKLFVALSNKFAVKSRENMAIGVDIFANSIESKHSIDELGVTLHRLRRSRHTVHTLPSTVYATIKFMLAHGQGKRLVEMLEDRHGVGLFPTVHESNFLMNYFLTHEAMEREAAKVACEMMLQEENGNEISRVLGLLSCIRYLSAENPSPWVKEEPKEETNEDDDEEDVYIRVPNVTNPWFDDHFDLQNEQDKIIGKTILHFASNLQSGVIRDTSRIVGLARRGRWEELKAEIAKIKEVSADINDLALKPVVSAKSTDEAGSEAEAGENSSSSSSDGESTEETAEDSKAPVVPDWVAGELEGLAKNKSTLASLLESEAKTIVSQHEAADIENQKRVMLEWQQRRKDALIQEEALIDRAQRIEKLRTVKKELVEKEEMYYAFENWSKIEMLLAEIDKEGVKEAKEEQYVPPTVNKPLLSKENAKN